MLIVKDPAWLADMQIGPETETNYNTTAETYDINKEVR